MNEPIRFRNLSWPLKVGIVAGWVIGVMYALMFLYGFFTGLTL